MQSRNLYIIIYYFKYSIVELDVTTPSQSSSPSSRVTSVDTSVSSLEKQPPTKRRKGCKGDDVDAVIIQSLKGIQERWPQKETQEEERKSLMNDEEGYFGMQVAATLRRLTSRQKAIAKLRIDQILVDVDCPAEPYPSTLSLNSYYQSMP